jgi:apolipoprotein D and lipocalin family protein
MRALLLAVVLAGCSTAVVAPLLPGYRDRTVPIASKADLDLDRYAGRWYEVARYPVPFQEGCAGAMAEYGSPEGGVLALRNVCLDPAGREIRTIAGEARVVGPGRLSVRLDGVPFVAPYWVLWVDEGYRTAVVGQPDDRAGWVLNRDPDIPDDRLRAARAVLEFNGYDIDALRRSGAIRQAR